MSADLQRLADWPERLIAHIEARRNVALAWGTNDCVLFAADAVLAMTGTDLAEGSRGLTKVKAQRFLKGVGGLSGLLASKLPLRPRGLAQRGDVVCVELDGHETAGIVSGMTWCAPGERGLVWRPMSEVQTVYAV